MTWKEIKEWIDKNGLSYKFITILLAHNGVEAKAQNIANAISTDTNARLRTSVEFVIRKFEKECFDNEI